MVGQLWRLPGSRRQHLWALLEHSPWRRRRPKSKMWKLSSEKQLVAPLSAARCALARWGSNVEDLNVKTFKDLKKCDEMWAMLYSWLDVLALGCIDPVSVWWSELDADSTSRKIMTLTHRRWFLSRALAVHYSLQPMQNRTGNTKSCCEAIDSYEQMLIAMNKWRH